MGSDGTSRVAMSASACSWRTFLRKILRWFFHVWANFLMCLIICLECASLVASLDLWFKVLSTVLIEEIDFSVSVGLILGRTTGGSIFEALSVAAL